MVLNVTVSDEVMKAMGGIPVVLSAPVEELQNRVLGRVILDEVHALLTPGGIVVPFELEIEEAKAIKKGNLHFFLHFINTDAIPPFRIIFDKEEVFGIEETNGNSFGLKGDNSSE